MKDAAVINFGELPNSMVLNVDGSLRGHDGCSAFTGTWALDGGIVKLTAMQGSEVACPDSGVDPGTFPDFESFPTAIVDFDTLYLIGADGSMVGALPRVTAG